MKKVFVLLAFLQAGVVFAPPREGDPAVCLALATLTSVQTIPVRPPPRNYPVRYIPQRTVDTYEIQDPADPELKLQALWQESQFHWGGTIVFSVRTRKLVDGNWVKSAHLKGYVEFAHMLNHFRSNDRPVRRIKGIWEDGTRTGGRHKDTDNLDQFNDLAKHSTATLEQVAALTWTGNQAVSAGFTQITVIVPENFKRGEYPWVNVYFVDPNAT